MNTEALYGHCRQRRRVSLANPRLLDARFLPTQMLILRVGPVQSSTQLNILRRRPWLETLRLSSGIAPEQM